ncbi:MAG TPA: hypothetical protein VNF74_03330 [Terriglobales bacterium]|nr:hypothetical protein [Terriglobales bacterium]
MRLAQPLLEEPFNGGKLPGSGTRRFCNRADLALRLGARCLHNSQAELGEFFRRMRHKLGTPGAITATFHKPTRIAYAPLATTQPYQGIRFADLDRRAQHGSQVHLWARAALLG